jgi:hypothetical protein
MEHEPIFLKKLAPVNQALANYNIKIALAKRKIRKYYKRN